MPDLFINPARVDFTTLRLFCEVAHAGSITKGAKRCHLALSAASRRISDFELASNATLLERTSQGVILTPAGHVALQHALRLTQGLNCSVMNCMSTPRGLVAMFVFGQTCLLW